MMNATLNEVNPLSFSGDIVMPSFLNEGISVKDQCSPGWVKMDTECFDCTKINSTSNALLKKKCLLDLSVDYTFLIVGFIVIIYSFLAMRLLAIDDNDSDVILNSGFDVIVLNLYARMMIGLAMLLRSITAEGQIIFILIYVSDYLWMTASGIILCSILVKLLWDSIELHNKRYEVPHSKQKMNMFKVTFNYVFNVIIIQTVMIVIITLAIMLRTEKVDADSSSYRTYTKYFHPYITNLVSVVLLVCIVFSSTVKLNDIFVQELRLVKPFSIGQGVIWTAYFVGDYLEKSNTSINQMFLMISFISILIITMDIPMIIDMIEERMRRKNYKRTLRRHIRIDVPMSGSSLRMLTDGSRLVKPKKADEAVNLISAHENAARASNPTLVEQNSIYRTRSEESYYGAEVNPAEDNAKQIVSDV